MFCLSGCHAWICSLVAESTTILPVMQPSSAPTINIVAFNTLVIPAVLGPTNQVNLKKTVQLVYTQNPTANYQHQTNTPLPTPPAPPSLVHPPRSGSAAAAGSAASRRSSRIGPEKRTDHSTGSHGSRRKVQAPVSCIFRYMQASCITQG